jgi:hypothetical protein
MAPPAGCRGREASGSESRLSHRFTGFGIYLDLGLGPVRHEIFDLVISAIVPIDFIDVFDIRNLLHLGDDFGELGPSRGSRICAKRNDG